MKRLPEALCSVWNSVRQRLHKLLRQLSKAAWFDRDSWPTPAPLSFRPQLETLEKRIVMTSGMTDPLYLARIGLPAAASPAIVMDQTQDTDQTTGNGTRAAVTPRRPPISATRPPRRFASWPTRVRPTRAWHSWGLGSITRRSSVPIRSRWPSPTAWPAAASRIPAPPPSSRSICSIPITCFPSGNSSSRNAAIISSAPIARSGRPTSLITARSSTTTSTTASISSSSRRRVANSNIPGSFTRAPTPARSRCRSTRRAPCKPTTTATWSWASPTAS